MNPMVVGTGCRTAFVMEDADVEILSLTSFSIIGHAKNYQSIIWRFAEEGKPREINEF
jgi:hypothetical protein